MRKMCHPIAVALFGKDREPMGSFESHNTALLESALNNPRQTFGGRDLYQTIENKAAILYYSLIKNHPFPNGNKRVATATMFVFLSVNNSAPDNSVSMENIDYLTGLAIRVAKSSGSQEKDTLLSEIADWLRKNGS
ncbi:type II toxin-antitoxin system death-on-curing family toxin [Candidatus Uhrbacteria bacterium]|nr:type II toxin-antitoxin system death-on-curing family toxin [Candidatus Uhrbacteria bacterium]